MSIALVLPTTPKSVQGQSRGADFEPTWEQVSIAPEFQNSVEVAWRLASQATGSRVNSSQGMAPAKLSKHRKTGAFQIDAGGVIVEFWPSTLAPKNISNVAGRQRTGNLLPVTQCKRNASLLFNLTFDLLDVRLEQIRNPNGFLENPTFKGIGRLKSKKLEFLDNTFWVEVDGRSGEIVDAWFSAIPKVVHPEAPIVSAETVRASLAAAAWKQSGWREMEIEMFGPYYKPLEPMHPNWWFNVDDRLLTASKAKEAIPVYRGMAYEIDSEKSERRTSLGWKEGYLDALTGKAFIVLPNISGLASPRSDSAYRTKLNAEAPVPTLGWWVSTDGKITKGSVKLISDRSIEMFKRTVIHNGKRSIVVEVDKRAGIAAMTWNGRRHTFRPDARLMQSLLRAETLK